MDVYSALTAEADDHELAVIEEVAERAGLIWTCPVAPWTNRKGERCGQCGRTKREAERHAARLDRVRR